MRVASMRVAGVRASGGVFPRCVPTVCVHTAAEDCADEREALSLGGRAQLGRRRGVARRGARAVEPVLGVLGDELARRRLHLARPA